MDGNANEERERLRRQRMRSLAIALALAALVALFYLATIVRLGGNADQPADVRRSAAMAQTMHRERAERGAWRAAIARSPCRASRWCWQ